MKKKKLYEGKTKKSHIIDNEDQLILEFKDDVEVAEEGIKKTVKGKGAICNEISGHLFQYLESYHIPTHFVRKLSEREMLVKKLDIIPVEIVVSNIAASDLAKKFNIEEGNELECPLTEFYLKDDEHQDSMVNLENIVTLGHATSDEMATIKRVAIKINAILKDYFSRRSLSLVDVRLEFGRYKGKLLLGDEVSPNSFRLWDLTTEERFNEEEYCQDIKSTGEKYQEIYRRIFR